MCVTVVVKLCYSLQVPVFLPCLCLASVNDDCAAFCANKPNALKRRIRRNSVASAVRFLSFVD